MGEAVAQSQQVQHLAIAARRQAQHGIAARRQHPPGGSDQRAVEAGGEAVLDQDDDVRPRVCWQCVDLRLRHDRRKGVRVRHREGGQVDITERAFQRCFCAVAAGDAIGDPGHFARGGEHGFHLRDDAVAQRAGALGPVALGEARLHRGHVDLHRAQSRTRLARQTGGERRLRIGGQRIAFGDFRRGRLGDRIQPGPGAQQRRTALGRLRAVAFAL